MSHRIFSYIAADILNPIRCLLFFTMEARDFLDLVKSYKTEPPEKFLPESPSILLFCGL